MAFDPNIPAFSNVASEDITAIKENFAQLRKNEAAASAPSNPAAGLTWADTSGSEVVLKVRNKANTAYTDIGFQAGTVMVFFQAAAPTGWTQVTVHNDKCLRIVSGAGGGSGGALTISSVNVSNTTLTVSQIPSHTHGAAGGHAHDLRFRGGSAGNTYFDTSTSVGEYGWDAYGSGYVSSEGSHSHPAAGGNAAHTHGLALAYIDVIIASKD